MSGLLVEMPVSVGELLDRISILAIKMKKITDEGKLIHIRKEYDLLTARRDDLVEGSQGLTALVQELGAVNLVLWDVEDRLRDMEQAGDFGPVFVENARAVYQTNDQRARIKARINALTGSALLEQKNYV